MSKPLIHIHWLSPLMIRYGCSSLPKGEQTFPILKSIFVSILTSLDTMEPRVKEETVFNALPSTHTVGTAAGKWTQMDWWTSSVFMMLMVVVVKWQTGRVVRMLDKMLSPSYIWWLWKNYVQICKEMGNYLAEHARDKLLIGISTISN